jgi:hypothetical protein
MDAATNTTRPVWTTPACPECGTQFRQEIHVPDHKARVAAVEVLLREGPGRPAQAEEPATSRLPDSVEAVQRMSWSDMQCLFAATNVDEIAAVQRSGGEALARVKLAALSEGDRRVLRARAGTRVRACEESSSVLPAEREGVAGSDQLALCAGAPPHNG